MLGRHTLEDEYPTILHELLGEERLITERTLYLAGQQPAKAERLPAADTCRYHNSKRL